jgi:hypothetical protein
MIGQGARQRLIAPVRQVEQAGQHVIHNWT